MKKRLHAKGIKLLLLLFGLFLTFSASAQTSISGKISGEGDKLPIIGASIKIKGTNIGAISDVDGKFSLTTSPNDVLIVSYTGYQTKEVTVGSKTFVTITLAVSNNTLNEVVVVGYGTQLKKDITGSVSTVNVSAAIKLPVSSSEQLLQGQASGVNILTSGVPGGNNFISIRGISSFANSSPLFVIDGVQSGSMSDVNPNDIESISVLKDAGAAAIYGVSGGNGVIVITTKKGKKGPSTLNYDAFYGETQPLQGNVFHLASVQQIAQFISTLNPGNKFFAGGKIPDYGYHSAGGSGFAYAGDPAVNPLKYNFDPTDGTGPANDYLIAAYNKQGQGTDWYHAAFKNAPTQSHSLSASGANDKNSYFVSFQYLDQEGTLINTYKKRYSGRANNTLNINDHIRIGETFNAFFTQTPGAFLNQDIGSPISYIAGASPIIPVYDIMGNYAGGWDGDGTIGAKNPVALQRYTTDNYDKSWNMQGTGFAEVDFLKHFTARTSLSFTTVNDYNKTISHNLFFDIIGHSLPSGDSENSSYFSTRQWTNTLNYNQTFGKHNIKVLGGFEQTQFTGSGQGGGANGFITLDPTYVTLSNGNSNFSNYSFIAQKYVKNSAFARLDYSYADKYLLGATVRRDGYSGFIGTQTYGTFPSVSLGWRISEESFMKGISWLNDLKIRGSAGNSGTFGGVPPNNAYSAYTNGLATGAYSFDGVSLTNGFYQAKLGNPRTHWETDKIANIGFDATLFGAVDLTVEYYKKSISGLLFPDQILATYGGAAPPYINVGNMENKGVDASLNYHGKAGSDFKYNVGVNFTSYKNTVVSVPGGSFGSSNSTLGYYSLNTPGQPVGEFYGYKVIGYFKDAADVTNSAKQQDAAAGRFKYQDVDGDGKITPNDRTYLGNPNPKFTYGFNLGASYKNFDFSMFLYGSQGNKVIYNPAGLTIDQVTNSWTPQNPNPKYPIAEAASTFSGLGTVINSWDIQDGSFLKARYITLGYSFSPAMLGKIGLTRLHIYGQVVNAFTITKYTGLDPELTPSAANNDPTRQSSGFGVDYGNYPNTERKFILGINMTIK
jgi:TonB-linked SusC/RagA family outer membrane protein